MNVPAYHGRPVVVIDVRWGSWTYDALILEGDNLYWTRDGRRRGTVVSQPSREVSQ